VVIGGDFSQGVERLGREADYPPPSVFGVIEWSCASTCPYVFIICTGRTWIVSVLDNLHRSLALGYGVKSFDRCGQLNVSVLSNYRPVSHHIYIQGVPGGTCHTSGGCSYVKVYRYNPKHLCPKLNGYGDNGQRKCGLLAGPRTVPVSWQPYPCPSLSVVSYYGNSAHARNKLFMYFLLGDKAVQVSAWHSCHV